MSPPALQPPPQAKDAPRSFSLSTTRTFAPGESVKIQLLARNVPELEFRVYKVRDAEKFFAGLKDLHSFGVQSYSPQEQIDQRTFVERLHDFKAHLWWLIRHFFRGQFTDEARDSFREAARQAGQAQPGGGRNAVRADSAAERRASWWRAGSWRRRRRW